MEARFRRGDLRVGVAGGRRVPLRRVPAAAARPLVTRGPRLVGQVLG